MQAIVLASGARRDHREDEYLHHADDRQHFPEVRLEQPTNQPPTPVMASDQYLRPFLELDVFAPVHHERQEHKSQAADHEMAVRPKSAFVRKSLSALNRYEKPAANMKLGMIVSA